MSFADFGRTFMERVVTPERVGATIASVVGDSIEVGPLAAGPRDSARASLRATLAGVDVEPTGRGEDVARFSAVVRLDCTLAVKAPVISKRYRGHLTIPLLLDVRTASPLRLVIAVEPPAAADIGVELAANDRSGRLIQLLGNIDGEVRTRAAGEVADRVESPEARRHRQVDVLAMVDEVWRP